MLREMISGVMKNYEDASYMTQQKARIFLFLEWIIFILVVLITLVMNLAIESELVSSRNAVRLAVLLLIVVAYVLLRTGKYGMAVNLCIFGSLAVMGAQVITSEFATSLEFSNRLFVLYIFIILAAMFSTAWSTFVSMAFLVAITAAAGLSAVSLPSAEVKNTIVNFTVGAVIISVVSFVLMRMVDSTIARIEASLQKEREHSMMKDLLESGLNLSGELASLSEHLKDENLNLSQRTVEHSAALEEVSATIEQTVAAIRQNAQSTGHASELTEEATRVAEEGARMINEAVDFIRDIDQSGEKIGQITAVINDIAFQTNILALNAAIEAARAGEAGRGFAVVAGEVRNLAARAGAAAGEISGLISQSISRIHQGSELVEKSGKALKNISASVKEVEMVVRDITRQSDEQHRGIEDIRSSITQMDLVVQENSALVERTSAVSDTLSRQARDLMSMLQGKNTANGKAAMLS